VTEQGVKHIIKMLSQLAAGEIEADRAKKRAEKIRQEYETWAWENRGENPNIGREVKELKLGLLALACIPNGIINISDLCQYSVEELLSSDGDIMHVREVQDALRQFGLVLKPPPEND